MLIESSSLSLGTNTMKVQNRLGVLDGLRGIAILQVVWLHIWIISWLPAPATWLQFIPETGMAGVRLFFFLSGFVVSYPFIQALFGLKEKPTWQHFAYRRFIKIVPSLVLSLLVVIGFGWASPAFADVRQEIWQIIANLLFISNWFPSTYSSINGVLWSLAVEVQFYLVFPLLWLAFKRFPYATCAVAFIGALVYRIWAETSPHSQLLIDQLPGHLDLFVAGMTCAYAFVRLRACKWPLRAFVEGGWTALGLAGFVGYVLLLQNFYTVAHSTVQYPAGWQTHWSVYGRCGMDVALFAAALGSLLGYNWWKAIVGNKLLVFFSVISYNLYLFHLPLSRALLMHGGLYGTDAEHADPHWQLFYTVTAFTFSILAATAITNWFERPLLNLKMSRKE